MSMITLLIGLVGGAGAVFAIYTVNAARMGKKAEKIKIKAKKCIITRNVVYFIFSFIFLINLWYYLSSFSAVYKNSQLIVIKNTLFSFLLSLLFPFLYYFLPAAFRYLALNVNKKNERLYRISFILQIL